ncbi:MAG: DciA family protein [Pseudomonadota bacterium]
MTKQAERKSRGFRQTGACLTGSIRRVTDKRGFAETRLLTDWATICGAEIAAITAPVRVTYAAEGFGATLVVYAPGARAPEVSMQRDLIRERVNACYGYNAIQRVKVTQTGAPPSGFAEKTSHFQPRARQKDIPEEIVSALQPVEDDGLRRALTQLGENVLSRTASTSERGKE